MWIDSHCHPFGEKFSEDQESVLLRARDAGVLHMVTVGYNKWANRQVIDLVGKYDFLSGVVGIHPSDCQDWNEEEEVWICDLAEAGEIVAVGEVGLDYHYLNHSKEDQERVFRAQIRLAAELGLPLVVHSRDAADDTMRILAEEGAQQVILHCFPYGPEVALEAVKRGYFIGISGILTFPNSHELRVSVEQLPLDCLLIETDCPYLAPQKYRGQRNEPAYVLEVAREVAIVKGVDLAVLEQQLLKNTEKAFNIFVS